MEDKKMMMPAGTYAVCDPCYIISDAWAEVCEWCFARDDNGRDGIVPLKDGRQVAIFGTAYGDGFFEGSDGMFYPVDSGTIGCMLWADCDSDDGDANIVNFADDFEVSAKDGVIRIGDITIDTSWPEMDEAISQRGNI